MTCRLNIANLAQIFLAVLALALPLTGCATIPKDYSAYTDEQLVAEHDKTSQKIASAEAQVHYLQTQAAYAATQEASAANNLSAAIVAAQLNQLRANRNAAIQEAERRLAQRGSSSRSESVVPQSPPPQAPAPAPSPVEPESVPPSEPRDQQETVPNLSLPVYPGGSQGHWVAEILSSGHSVRLEDGSMWEVDSVDAIDSALWLTTESIIVVGKEYKGYVFYDLINTDSKDKVGASYLGKAVLWTQIEGDFEGWDGDTVFALANGNILKQATYQYTYHYAYRPDVIVVDRGGSYVLVVDGVEETVGVVVIR
jgi:hypothetical protein